MTIQTVFFSPGIVDGVCLPARLPDLSVVIVVDSKLPGTFHMNDVMQAGDSSHVKQLRALQQTLSCNEPINIQFTSVSASVCSMTRGWVPKWGNRENCEVLSIMFPSALLDQALVLSFSSLLL